MPPAAATAAARRSTARPLEDNPYPEAYTKRPGQANRPADPQRAPRRVASAAPATPRRVASIAPASPPRRAATTAAPAHRDRTAPARPRTAPHTAPAPARRPRTLAPNPHPVRVARPARRSVRVQRPLPRLGLIVRLPRGGKLLDSLVRGRAWIPMLGVLLVGIVGMRVEVLKLGSSVGSEMQQSSVLESANAALQKQVSALSNNQRIEQLAARQGMVLPGPLDIHFVHATGAASVNRAIADISQPSPSTFLSSVVSERAHDGAAAVTAATTSAIGVLGGGSIPGNTSPSSAGSSPQITTTAAPTSAAGATDPSAAGSPPALDTSGGAGTSTGSPVTQTQTPTQGSAGTGVTQGTAPPASPSTVSGTPDTSAPTDNVPAATSTDSNGAASLGG